MVNIELTPQQAEELKNFYISELDKLLKRSDVIKEIINKLDTEHAHIRLPETMQLKEQTPKEITSLDETETKNPKWIKFVVQILQEQQKPLSSKAIIKLYQKRYKISNAELKTSKYNLAQALYILRVKTKEVQSIKTVGKKEKLYGLIDWTDKSLPGTKINTKTQQSIPDTAIELDTTASSNFSVKWPPFIKEILTKQNRVLSANEILLYAMKHFEIPADKKRTTRGSLSPTLSYLKKNGRLINSMQKVGVRGVSYGLLEWFDEDGKLIVDYK